MANSLTFVSFFVFVPIVFSVEWKRETVTKLSNLCEIANNPPKEKKSIQVKFSKQLELNKLICINKNANLVQEIQTSAVVMLVEES